MKSPQNQKHKGEALMHILDELHLESNNKIKINLTEVIYPPMPG